jgi:hypothetical protein
MAPKTAISALNLIEARVSGDLLALNRLIMTFLNKRMPVAGFTVGRDGGGMRATILLDCTPETARRYAALLSNLEDVERIEFSGKTMEVALLKVETSHAPAGRLYGLARVGLAGGDYGPRRGWHDRGGGGSGEDGSLARYFGRRGGRHRAARAYSPARRRRGIEWPGYTARRT